MDSKLPNTGTTIFTVMSQLAAQHDAINLSQGFPSFDPPDDLLKLVCHYLNAGANQYAPMQGIPALRNAIALKTEKLYGPAVSPETEITVCDGATEGLFSAIQAVVRGGDQVIVLDPAYDAYEPSVTLAGGQTIHVPLRYSETELEFEIDWQRLRDAINEKTRLIVLNFPHNPTGANLVAEDLDRLAETVRDTDVYLLSDEVYEHFVFDGADHQSMLRHEELRARSLVISSFGKTYNATGWKVGHCIAPPGLTEEFRKVHQFTCFAVVTPIQHALADYMVDAPGHFEQLPAFYESKRDKFCALLAPSRFRLRPAQGTFFQLLDYTDISDEDDCAYAERLTTEIGVASIPISPFCQQPPPGRNLRFCFAKDDTTLERAAEKLCQL